MVTYFFVASTLSSLSSSSRPNFSPYDEAQPRGHILPPERKRSLACSLLSSLRSDEEKINRGRRCSFPHPTQQRLLKFQACPAKILRDSAANCRVQFDHHLAFTAKFITVVTANLRLSLGEIRDAFPTLNTWQRYRWSRS